MRCLNKCAVAYPLPKSTIMKNLNCVARLVVLSLAACITAYSQTVDQNITVTVKPSQTVEERVADSVKERQLREAAEEKLAAEKSARIASKSPRALLSRAQTIFIESGTSYFESAQLENALRKRSEFEAWEMAIIGDWQQRKIADILIEVDRPLFTFTFTYKITDRENGILLSTGKVTAFDGNAAAPLLTARIIEDIRKARGK